MSALRPTNAELGITEQGNFKDGRKEGLWVLYDEKGQIQIIGNYKNGKEDGLWRCYASYSMKGDCGLRTRVMYKEGEKHGLWEQLDGEGHIEESCYYKNGKLDGVSKSFHMDQLVMKENFKDGERDGLQEIYHANGQLGIRKNYKNGEVYGSPEYFDEKGHPADLEDLYFDLIPPNLDWL